MQTAAWAAEGRTRVSSASIHDIIRRKVWEARILAHITVSEDELRQHLPAEQVSALNYKTRPFFALVPRTSYFPLFLSQLRRHFDTIFTAMGQALPALTPWLDFQGHPLDWHYPIGHLYDECHCWSADDAPSRPWTLTLHFTHYPATLLPSLECQSEEGGGALGMHFYSMLKQADFIRHGSPKGMNNLSKNEQSQLWDGVWTHSFDRFWRVGAKLVGSEDYQASWRSLPMRLYLKDSFRQSRRIIQAQVSPQSCTTLEDALCHLEVSVESVSVYMHGVALPLDTLLSWLALYFIFPDGFLHLIIVQEQ